MSIEHNEKVFRLSNGWKVFFIFGILFAITMVAFIISLWSSVSTILIFAAFLPFLLFIALGVLYFALALKRYSITVEDTLIKVQNPFMRQKIDLTNFESYRTYAGNGAFQIILCPTDVRKKKHVSIAVLIKEKNALLQHISGYRVYLDQKEYAKELDTIVQDQRLGVDEKERLEAIGRAAKINRAINGIVFAVILAGFFLPQYRNIVTIILGVIPFVALMLIPVSNGRFKFNTGINSPYPSVLYWFLSPIGGLLFYNISYLDRILNFSSIIFPTLVLMALLTTVLFICTAKEKKIR